MWIRLLKKFPSNTGTSHVLRPEVFLHRREPKAVVIDVRTPEEFAQGHLEDAINIDLMAPDFHEKIAQLDPNRTYYLYCRSGSRSEQAARLLRAHGLKAYNIGGLGDLARAGVPIVSNHPASP